jgi:hypothetical protein
MLTDERREALDEDDAERGDPALRAFLRGTSRRGSPPSAAKTRHRACRGRVPGDVPASPPGLPTAQHGEHLRSWILTIAKNVAVDTLRRTRPQSELLEQPIDDDRPAYEELAPLTDGLPQKERAAVVLRYGYDLSYDQIAVALGSSEDAARQAASTGVRKLRRRIT